jgi:hypothetical protein
MLSILLFSILNTFSHISKLILSLNSFNEYLSIIPIVLWFGFVFFQ